MGPVLVASQRSVGDRPCFGVLADAHCPNHHNDLNKHNNYYHAGTKYRTAFDLDDHYDFNDFNDYDNYEFDNHNRAANHNI